MVPPNQYALDINTNYKKETGIRKIAKSTTGSTEPSSWVAPDWLRTESFGAAYP